MKLTNSGKKAALIAMAAILLVTISYKMLSAYLGIVLNSSPSMPEGLYVYKAHSFPKTRNEIVYFCPPRSATEYMVTWHSDEIGSGSCIMGVPEFIKYAVGLPGDKVNIDNKGVHINGGPALLGSISIKKIPFNGATKKTHPITPQLPTNYFIVPPGHIFAYTPQWFSYDSRYYGPIIPDGVARPIFVDLKKPESKIPVDVLKTIKD